MFKKRHLRRRRCKYRRIRQSRDFVAEVCTGDDCAGNPPLRETLRLTDTHQRDTNRGNRRPRTARHDRHRCTNQARHTEEHLRMNQLQTVADKRRHDAANHPRSGNGSDKEQNDDGRCGGVDVFDYRTLQLLPTAATHAHRKCCGNGRSKQQSNLTTTQDGIRTEALDYQCQYHHQNNEWDGCNPHGRQ